MKEQIIRATAWNAFGQFTGQAMRVLVLFLLARLLSKEDFGLVAMANLLVTFLSIFSNSGFNEAIIQREELDDVSRDTAFWTMLLMGGLLTVFCCACAPLVAYFFAEPALTSITAALSLSFTVSGASAIQEALLRREIDFKPIALRFTAGRVAGGCVGILGAWAGWGVWSLVSMQLTEQVVGGALLWLKGYYRPRFRFSPPIARSYFSFGLNLTGVQLFGYLKNNIDQIIIGRLLGAELLGAYSVMQRIVFFIYGTMNAVYSMVFYTVYCKLSKDASELLRMFYKSINLFAATAFPLLLLCIFFHEPLIRLALGDKWLAWSPLVAVMAVPTFFNIVFWQQQNLYTAVGRPSVRLALTLATVIFSIPFILWGARWGIYGVAWASVAATLLFIPVNFIVAKRIYGCSLRETLRAACPPTVLAVVLFAAGWALLKIFHIGMGWGQYAVIGVCCILYAALILALDRQNFRFILSMVRSKWAGSARG